MVKNQKTPHIVFIPTASNVETGDKDWLIDDLINIKNQNFKSITITDISAVQESIWRPQLEKADILFFEGGNSCHLMKWMNKSGLVKLLPELLKTKVYVGLSAGSMVASPDLAVLLSKIIYEEDVEDENMKGLGLVDFYFLPHLNNPHFAPRIEANLKKAMKGIDKKIYILDDQSALKVVNGLVEKVGSGKHIEFN